MVTYYKTIDDQMTILETWQPGCWIRCVNPTQEEVDSLIADFEIEPEFFRAAMDEEESSHIDSEDGNTLIILDSPIVAKPDENITYTTVPVGIILTQKTVITISMQENPVLTEFASGAVKGVQTNLKTRFVLTIMLRIAGRFLQYLKQIEKISNFMEMRLRKSMKNNELIQLLDIEKSLMYFSASLKANEITLEKIMRGRIIRMYEEDQDLLEDVLIEIRQGVDMSNLYLNVLSGTMDAFASVISNNLNIVMKVLTSVTLLISIPTLISGIYGMNTDLPMAHFWFPIALSAVLMAVTFFILKKKDMF